MVRVSTSEREAPVERLCHLFPKRLVESRFSGAEEHGTKIACHFDGCTKRLYFSKGRDSKLTKFIDTGIIM